MFGPTFGPFGRAGPETHVLVRCLAAVISPSPPLDRSPTATSPVQASEYRTFVGERARESDICNLSAVPLRQSHSWPPYTVSFRSPLRHLERIQARVHIYSPDLQGRGFGLLARWRRGSAGRSGAARDF